MANLNQLELQNLRYIINTNEIMYKKLNAYSTQCVDPQIKQTLTKAAQDALNVKQKFMSFLNE